MVGTNASTCTYSMRRITVVRKSMRTYAPRTADREIRAVDRARVATPPDACRSLPPPQQHQRTRGGSRVGVAEESKPPPPPLSSGTHRSHSLDQCACPQQQADYIDVPIHSRPMKGRVAPLQSHEQQGGRG
jgi:hypothetical protein